MKRIVINVILALGLFAACMFCWIPTARAAAVWDIDLTNQYGNDPTFSLVGQFTTATTAPLGRDPDLILSFEGTLNGQVVGLTPLGTDPAFLYDNLFYGPTDLAAGWSTVDAFDNAGVVIGGVNVFAGGVLVGLFDTGESVALAGDITFAGFTTSVPEAPAAVMLLVGVLFLRRWRQGRTFATEAGRDVDETNKVLADNYLRDIAPVASRAGSEPSETFEQWFTRHTGKPPTLVNSRYYALTKEATLAKAAWEAARATASAAAAEPSEDTKRLDFLEKNSAEDVDDAQLWASWPAEHDRLRDAIDAAMPRASAGEAQS